jgi:undecaprenyl-phosphate 4-deoxy-4-formamido-L-arabinose transferase
LLKKAGDFINMKLLSFVIPCYRSESTIEKVYHEIVEVVAERREFDYEIIAINDFSPDNVLRVLKKIGATDKKFKVIDLAKNFGKHGAMMAGYAQAKGDYIVNLDDDYQCPVNELWKLIDAIEKEGYDCATAKYERKIESSWKRLGSSVNKAMVRMMLNPPTGIELENFSVFKRFIKDEVLQYHNPYPYVAGLVLQATHRIKMIPMKERNRADDNRTGFTLVKSVALLLNGLTSFSVKPLRMATIIGVLFALLGFIYGIVVIVRRLVNPMIPMGYSALMTVQLFSSGVIMMILGMIGEYLGRIYISINNMPQYVIRERLNCEEDT